MEDLTLPLISTDASLTLCITALLNLFFEL